MNLNKIPNRFLVYMFLIIACSYVVEDLADFYLFKQTNAEAYEKELKRESEVLVHARAHQVKPIVCQLGKKVFGFETAIYKLPVLKTSFTKKGIFLNCCCWRI